MKHLIYISSLLFIFTTLYSCSKKTKISAKQQQDSIAKMEAKKQHIQDSINKEKSLIAWGQIKFGTSMKDVAKTKMMRDCSIGDDYLMMDYDVVEEIRNAFSLSELMSFYAYFEEDELTSIEMRSYPKTADHIDDLVSECNTLSDIFKKKMGNPFNSQSDVDISNFNEGHEFIYASYVMSTKCVLIKLGEDDEGGEFYYTIFISNSDFPKKKHVPSKEEIKKQKEEDTKRKYIQNNSF